ncbi:MAG: hypothetical protein JNM19_15095 [Chitinophagaceae bacterium]|nr:hypothetical protein [Chitinophagaceae bacterium]
MNFLISIYILSAIGAKQDSIYPVYFYETQSCAVFYVITHKMKLDLSNKDYFIFSTISEKSGITGIQKPKPNLNSVTGKWTYADGILTLYPLNLLSDHRGLYPDIIQFKADLFCLEMLTQDKSIKKFPGFMASPVAPRL